MQEKKTTKNLKIRKVCIIGVIPSFAFQRAKYCALELHRKLPQRFPLPEIVGLLELDWSEKLQEWRQMLGREYWCLRRPVAVFFDNRFIGSDIELIKLTTISNILIENIPRKDMSCIQKNFRKDYMSYLKKSKSIYCYLDICIDDVYAGTLTFRLYSDLLPRTCENFKTLCLGTRGPLLSYKGSRIHRIVKKGWLQGGDIQYKTGGGGFSIFCDPLEDECYGISHNRRGVLSMANAGRHKNGSQFFITLQPSKWMDTHFVAFGQLVEGVKVLTTLENLETAYESPISKVEIKNCGKLDLGDVEDVDALFKEDAVPVCKAKKIEALSREIVKMIVKALTEALEKRVYPRDILHDGDVLSKMNLQLYFQGFYSLPESVLEKIAEYLRKIRRELLRVIKPSATEIVESLMYDLQMAVLTRMINLDDVKETIGQDTYGKMIGEIDLTIDSCSRPYVKGLIDQIVTTAENMVELVTKKLVLMKRQSKNLKNFQDKMQKWMTSFVLQETFDGDNYFIAQRPPLPEDKTKAEVYCNTGKKGQVEEYKMKLIEKKSQADLCCLGSELHISDSVVNFSEYFNTCRYDLKNMGKREKRMPLLDMIEISRFKLRWLRKQEQRKRSAERLCTDKQIRRWMDEVVYTPETDWLRNAVFPKDCKVLDHVEEIMYGAMTAGLLEMYFYMHEYLRMCGIKQRKLITRTIYPGDSSTDLVETTDAGKVQGAGDEAVRDADGDENRDEEEQGEAGEAGEDMVDDTAQDTDRDGRDGSARSSVKKQSTASDRKSQKQSITEKPLPPCPCGHPCCDCKFDPNRKKEEITEPSKTVKKKPSRKWRRGEGEGEAGEGEERYVEEEEEETESEEESEGGTPEEGTVAGPEATTKEKEEEKEEVPVEEKKSEEKPPPQPCKSDETLVDLNLVLAQKLSTTPEEVNFHSFKWLKPYIVDHGCDLKTEFATRVHNWIEGERFNCGGMLSKHSLVTRASLLSLSFSLTELFKEDNNLKNDLRNFVYDLWDLYFEEMFKEALLEFPPDVKEESEEDEEGKPDKSGKKRGKEKKTKKVKAEEPKKGSDFKPCEGLEDYPDFDLEEFCKEAKRQEEEENEEENDENLESRQPGSQYETPRRLSLAENLAARDEGAPRKSVVLDDSAVRKSIVQESGAQKSITTREDWSSRKSVTADDPSPGKSLVLEDSAPRKSVTEEAVSRKSVPTQGQSSASSSREDLADASEESEKEDKEPDEESDEEYRTTTMKKVRSPIVVKELVIVPSEEEIRKMPPYKLPFWVKFLTETTKQALGAFSRASRLPRRLYYKSDSETAFDQKMKDWFDFNAFNPQPTKGREIMDFIALHHRSKVDMEDTVRSFLKKRKYLKLINSCTRHTSADDVAGELVADTIRLSKKQAKEEEETLELFVSNAMESAVASSKTKSQSSDDEDTVSVSIETNEKAASVFEGED